MNNFSPNGFRSIILVTLLPLVHEVEKQKESDETVVWWRETGRQRTIALEHETEKRIYVYTKPLTNPPL